MLNRYQHTRVIISVSMYVFQRNESERVYRNIIYTYILHAFTIL